MNKTFTLLFLLISIANFAYSQCTKLVKYDAEFETVTEEIEVEPAYTKTEIIQAAYWKNIEKKILIKSAYVDHVACFSDGICTGYKPKTIPSEYRTIYQRIYIEAVTTKTYVPAKHQTITRKVKVKDAEVKLITIDCN